MPDLEAVRDIRNAFIADVNLTAIVPASNIHMGWKQEPKVFPCIVISQAGGGAVGLTGIANASVGNRVAKENPSFQIDIYSRKNVRQTLEICGLISNILLVSGWEKMADINRYENEIEAFRKTTTWRITNVYNF